MGTFQYMLAPMEGITDDPFRKLCHKHGADLTFTPMARISGLSRGNKVTLARSAIESSTPTEIQLLGNRPDQLERFLSRFEPNGGFQGFNLNLGCSSPQVLKDGLGSAMIKRITRVSDMITVIKDHGYSASIKMRLGMNSYEEEKGAYLNLIEGVDANYFIVHARNGQQDLSQPVNLSAYQKCVETGKTIIANGDIRTLEHVKILKEWGVGGVMIGRAAVEDPKIFSEIRK